MHREPAGVNDTVFETPRLRVRRWRESDLPGLAAVYGDAEAMRWVGDGRPLDAQACRHWLDVTRGNYARRGYGMFAVEWKVTPGLVGCCGIVHPGGQPEAELKYAYLRQVWGQGIATEALIGLIGHAIGVHGLRRLIATAAPENTASHHVLRKAGMTVAERRRNEDGSETVVFEVTAPKPLA